MSRRGRWPLREKRSEDIAEGGFVFRRMDVPVTVQPDGRLIFQSDSLHDNGPRRCIGSGVVSQYRRNRVTRVAAASFHGTLRVAAREIQAPPSKKLGKENGRPRDPRIVSTLVATPTRSRSNVMQSILSFQFDTNFRRFISGKVYH